MLDPDGNGGGACGMAGKARMIDWTGGLCALLLALGPGGARAAGEDHGNGPRYWFLDRLSPTDLDRYDWLMLRQNVLLALYDLDDGQAVGWVNPQNGHSGSARVVGSTEMAGLVICRRLQVSLDTGTGSDMSHCELCLDMRGFWTFPEQRRP